MNDYLLLKLQSPLQAWGRESFEGLRPSELFPGRSALLGLLGACLGIDRTEQIEQTNLAASTLFAVRVDQQGQKMTDYHTVKNARKDYKGLKSHETIQTWREYWQDARYTVAIWSSESTSISLQQIENAIKRPIYTPTLGRRSCPLARPLFDKRIQAESSYAALSAVDVGGKVIYSEEYSSDAIPIRKRDNPIIHQPRQFASRMIYMRNVEGVAHVSE